MQSGMMTVHRLSLEKHKGKLGFIKTKPHMNQARVGHFTS